MRCKMSKNGVEFEFEGSAEEIGSIVATFDGGNGRPSRDVVELPEEQRSYGKGGTISRAMKALWKRRKEAKAVKATLSVVGGPRSRKFKHWTEMEIGLIKEHVSRGSPITEIARALGRTRRSVRARIRLLSSVSSITDDRRIQQLREAGRKGGKMRWQNARLRKALAKKTQPVQPSPQQPVPNAKWSSTEDDYLRNWVGKLTVAQIAVQLNRPLSTVYQSIHRIGLGSRIKVVSSMGPIPEDEQNASV